MENRKSFIKDYEIKVCSTLVKNGFKCYNYSDIRKYPRLNKFSSEFYDNMHVKPILMNLIISNILISPSLFKSPLEQSSPIVISTGS